MKFKIKNINFILNLNEKVKHYKKIQNSKQL